MLIAISGLFAVSFGGVYNLLRVLYVLRLGHGPEYVGLFGAAGALTYMAMGLPAGALGERLGLKRVMAIGGAITVLGMGLLSFTEMMPGRMQYYWPILSQVLLIMGWSTLNINSVPAMMAFTTPENRNSAYAWSTSLRNLGTFLGTLVGGLLPGAFVSLLGGTLDDPAPYRNALWVSSALGIVALVPLFLVRRVAPTISRQQVQDAKRPFPMSLVALMSVHVFLTHGGWSTAQAFGNAYMDTDLRLTPSAIGVIAGGAQLLAVVAALLGPRLARRRTNGWALMAASLGMGISLLPLGLIEHWAAAGVGRMGVLALDAVWMPSMQVFQMEQVAAEHRTLAYGISSMAMGLAFASVSLLGGFLSAAAGYRSVFLLGGGLCGLAAVLMWALRRGQAGHQPGVNTV